MDGQVSGWQRGPYILRGSSVPIIAESRFKPLHLNAWVPWYHYVPVKNDLSDLITNIKWLIEHDKEAEQIAING